MLKKVTYWCLLLSPTVILCGLLFLFATATYIIHISMDSDAFTRTARPFQKLAQHVYSRQRTYWQAQSHCIQFDELLLYRPKPGTCEFNNLEYSTDITFNRKGFREVSTLTFLALQVNSSLRPQLSVRPYRGRIIVLGDSQAMGWGVQDEETFASVLAAEFGYEVVNLAVSSYGTARELMRLRKDFDLKTSDIVIIQYHQNDLTENRTFLESGGLRKHSPSDLGSLIHTPQRYNIPQVSISIAWSLWEVLRQRVRGAFPSRWASNSESMNPAQTFLAVLNHFEELSQVKIVVCEVPSWGQESSFTKDLKRLKDRRMSVVTPIWESSDFYRLDEHLNSTGHRKLARLIANTIVSD